MINIIYLILLIIWVCVLTIRLRKNRKEISIYNLMYKNQTRDIGKEIVQRYRGGYQPNKGRLSSRPNPPPKPPAKVNGQGCPVFYPDIISENGKMSISDIETIPKEWLK